MNLQSGTVKALYNSQKSNPLYINPVLQITSLGKLNMGDGIKQRYKANVSDGQFYMKAVFSSELCNFFDEGQIVKNHLIKLGGFTIRPKENNNYLYIQSILENRAQKDLIGMPVNIITGKLPTESLSLDQNKFQSNTRKTELGDQKVVIKRSRENEMQNSKKRNSIGTTKNSNKINLIAIKDCNPFQTNWMIKGRVMSKSDIRNFKTGDKEGQLFSFELADSTAQLKCVGFDETVDLFYHKVELNKVYTISNAGIKIANKKYAMTNFDYEISLSPSTVINLVDDNKDIPLYAFKFVNIFDLKIGPSFVDVVAVVQEVYPLNMIISKSGNELKKRDLVLVDETGSCRLTLWGDKSEKEYVPGTILCLKGVRVGEFNGLVLSTVGVSQVLSDLDIEEVNNLKQWYAEKGHTIKIEKPRRNINVSLINEVKEDGYEYSHVIANILYIREEMIFYMACPSENCNKKVVLENNGKFRCEKCNYLYPNCFYRYMFSVHVGDFSGQIWLTLFDETGFKLFGITADEFKEMKEQEPSEANLLLKDLTNQEFLIKIKSREEEYNGEIKKRYTCLDIQPVNYEEETNKMLDIIEKIKI